jgi:hypothetical protein
LDIIDVFEGACIWIIDEPVHQVCPFVVPLIKRPLQDAVSVLVLEIKGSIFVDEIFLEEISFDLFAKVKVLEASHD